MDAIKFHSIRFACECSGQKEDSSSFPHVLFKPERNYLTSIFDAELISTDHLRHGSMKIDGINQCVQRFRYKLRCNIGSVKVNFIFHQKLHKSIANTVINILNSWIHYFIQVNNMYKFGQEGELNFYCLVQKKEYLFSLFTFIFSI